MEMAISQHVNRAQVIIRGKKYPQVGTICMDQMMINIEWDSAYNGTKSSCSAKRMAYRSRRRPAAWAGTIPYEILTNINTRVPTIHED